MWPDTPVNPPLQNPTLNTRNIPHIHTSGPLMMLSDAAAGRFHAASLWCGLQVRRCVQGDRKDFKIHDALTVKLHFSILFYARHRVKSGMSAPVVLQVLQPLNTSELIFTQPVFLRSRAMSGYEGILSFCRLDFLFITKASRFKHCPSTAVPPSPPGWCSLPVLCLMVTWLQMSYLLTSVEDWMT